jgi:hypothetical protein
MPATVTTSNSFSLRSWVGDTDQFLKLVSILDELVETAMLRVSSSIDAEESGDFDARYSYLSKPERGKLWKQQVADKKESYRGQLRPTLTVTQKKYGRQTAGDPESVVTALDLEDKVLKMVLTVGSVSRYRSPGYWVEVRLSTEWGCDVQISSPDSDWTTIASDKLLSALRPRNPWYSVLRSIWAPWLIVFAPTFLVAAIKLISVGLSTGFNDASFGALDIGDASFWSALFSGIGQGVLQLAIYFALWQITKRLVPAFEILERGQTAQGLRRIGFLATALLWVGGIVIPILIGVFQSK